MPYSRFITVPNYFLTSLITNSDFIIILKICFIGIYHLYSLLEKKHCSYYLDFVSSLWYSQLKSRLSEQIITKHHTIINSKILYSFIRHRKYVKIYKFIIIINNI